MADHELVHALREHAYTMGQCVLAYARIEGMKAENETAIRNGFTAPYGEKQFEDAMTEFQIDHNSVIPNFIYR